MTICGDRGSSRDESVVPNDKTCRISGEGQVSKRIDQVGSCFGIRACGTSNLIGEF